MPYTVRKKGDRYQVVKKDDGKVVGTHSSKAAAQKQVRAIYANEEKR